MQARLLQNANGLWLLFSNGLMVVPSKNDLKNLFFSFKMFKSLQKSTTTAKPTQKWNDECPEMSAYPGKTLAYIGDTQHLVIVDPQPFEVLLNGTDRLIGDYLSVAKYAQIYNKSPEQVKVFCRTGRIPGAIKLNRDWIIPYDAPYPLDQRFSIEKKIPKKKSSSQKDNTNS